MEQTISAVVVNKGGEEVDAAVGGGADEADPELISDPGRSNGPPDGRKNTPFTQMSASQALDRLSRVWSLFRSKTDGILGNSDMNAAVAV